MRIARAVAFAAVFAACGDEAPVDPRCVDAPTFADEVRPIAEAKCATCHAPDANRRGAREDLNFHEWGAVEPVKEDFADALTSGRMPPVGVEPAVTADERALVSRWRVCGFRE